MFFFFYAGAFCVLRGTRATQIEEYSAGYGRMFRNRMPLKSFVYTI